MGSLFLLGPLSFRLRWQRSEQRRPLLVASNNIPPIECPKAKKGPCGLAMGPLGSGQQAGVSSSLCASGQVHAFDQKLEEMSNQVLQWQKQHQSDLKMLAAKEEQLRAFQEEMNALKENLLADEKEVGAPLFLVTSSQPLLAHRTTPWMPDSRWWEWRCLGARTPTLFSAKQGLGALGPQRRSQPSHLPVALLIEISSRTRPHCRGERVTSPCQVHQPPLT